MIAVWYLRWAGKKDEPAIAAVVLSPNFRSKPLQFSLCVLWRTKRRTLSVIPVMMMIAVLFHNNPFNVVD